MYKYEICHLVKPIALSTPICLICDSTVELTTLTTINTVARMANKLKALRKTKVNCTRKTADSLASCQSVWLSTNSKLRIDSISATTSSTDAGQPSASQRPIHASLSGNRLCKVSSPRTDMVAGCCDKCHTWDRIPPRPPQYDFLAVCVSDDHVSPTET